MLFILLILLVLFLNPRYVKKVMITNQNTDEIYFSRIVEASDIITYGWIHSFELIPWTEDYEIEENNKLLLKRITIAGFGAGIPHDKGIVTIDENGIIIMDEINEEFPEINWIHSQTATEYISINGEVIMKGKDLPHHESLRLEIKERVNIWRN